MKVKSIDINRVVVNTSLEDIFATTGLDIDEEVLSISPITGGRWYDLPEPIMVETLGGDRPATQVWLNGNTNYVSVKFEDESEYNCTHHHKFLSVKDGMVDWKLAINLQPGDEIITDADTVIKVKNVTVSDNKTITMDINVEEVHHYVLDNGVISHNSSISGATTNGIYPIRDYYLNKTNETLSINYVVPDSTRLKNKYQIAWDIDSKDLIDCYAIVQKWTDQAISADLYRRLQGEEKVSTTEMLKGYFQRFKYGLKTRYYVNSLTAKGVDLNASEEECDSCSI